MFESLEYLIGAYVSVFSFSALGLTSRGILYFHHALFLSLSVLPVVVSYQSSTITPHLQNIVYMLHQVFYTILISVVFVRAIFPRVFNRF